MSWFPAIREVRRGLVSSASSARLTLVGGPATLATDGREHETMVEASHEVLEHVGELELRLRAPDLPGLLREAAAALAAELLRGQAGQPDDEVVLLDVESGDRAALLVDWLNELVYRADAEGRVLTGFDFEHVDETRLRCRARGVRVVADVPVKAATFHGLAVETDADGALQARVILDI
jgi:SHS2 domain-containing protein